MLYTLDRVTCDETIVDNIHIRQSAPAALALPTRLRALPLSRTGLLVRQAILPFTCSFVRIIGMHIFLLS